MESLPNTNYTLVKLPIVRACKSHLLMHQNIDQWPILSDTQAFRFPGVKQPAVLFPVTAAEGHREYPEDAEGRGSVSNSSDPPL